MLAHTLKPINKQIIAPMITRGSMPCEIFLNKILKNDGRCFVLSTLNSPLIFLCSIHPWL